MTAKITAIRKLRPELKRMPTMQTPELVEEIAGRSALSAGEILYVVYEARDMISLAARRGQAVKVEGLGTFTPTLSVDGRLSLAFRADPAFLHGLNSKNLYAEVVNKANIGKSAEELVALWNEAHPDDPVQA